MTAFNVYKSESCVPFSQNHKMISHIPLPRNDKGHVVLSVIALLVNWGHALLYLIGQGGSMIS